MNKPRITFVLIFKSQTNCGETLKHIKLKLQCNLNELLKLVSFFLVMF